jgi:ABC-type nitrate/sulfonate/bicarbonate transport system substrate-binding protein
MGGDTGLLHLIVQPHISSYADLREQTLSVDARTTGYAFVLQKMLERGGLKRTEYSLAEAGGVLQRWQALRRKEHAGTLLVTPFDLAAESAGFRRLDSAAAILPHYQGLVGAARRSWARAHEGALIGFIKAYRAALTWLFDRANRPAAIALLTKNAVDMTPELASRTYDALLVSAHGIDPGAALDVEGVRQVLALRREYARPMKPLAEPGTYYDLAYYERATR